MMLARIDAKCLREALGLEVSPQFGLAMLGLVGYDSEQPFLTFVDEAKYLGKANADERVAGAFVRAEDSSKLRSGITALVVEDPRWAFYTLLNHRAANRGWEPNQIHETAVIHASAVIASEGVSIGAHTVVEARAVIQPGTVIGERCLIRAGAVIGCDGFEHKRTGKGILSVLHDGGVVIRDRAEIGPNNSVAKGFSYRNTIVGTDSKFDALVHFAHGAQCGEECFIAANAMIAGSVTLGKKVWVGPSVSVSNLVRVGDGASLTIGAVVVADVEAGAKVSGNFAVPHYAFLRFLRKTFSGNSKE